MKQLQLQPIQGAAKQAQAEHQLREAIRKGLLQVGDPLPSIRNLAGQFAVHRNTVYWALMNLVAEGWLCAEARRGFFVDNLAKHFIQKRPQEIKKIQPEFQYDLRSGVCDLRLLDVNQFKRHLNKAINQMSVHDFGYGLTAGHPKFLTRLSEYLAQTRQMTQQKLIVTNGAIEAASIIVQNQIKPGDVVAMAEYTYPIMRDLFEQYGAKIVAIKLDEHGLSTEDLEHKLQKHKVKMVYVTPLYQYPTTVTMPIERRRNLLALAGQYHFNILEDDYVHELYYQQIPPPSLASMDQNNCVFYMSSFSKVLFPAIRLGFAAVPAKDFEAVLQRKYLASNQTEVFIQLAVAHMMQSGYFERYIRKVRRSLKERRDALYKTLENYPQLEFSKPLGGNALWIRADKELASIVTKAEKNKIRLVTESFFSLCSSRKPQHYFRLGFAGYTPKEMKRLLRWLME